MTSTNFNVGLGTDRNSSRVLRPPGGGHTDIFGAAEPPVRKDSGRNASSIMEGTNANPVNASPAKPSQPPPKNEPPAQQPASAPRGRVPPGGFSSGLW